MSVDKEGRPTAFTLEDKHHLNVLAGHVTPDPLKPGEVNMASLREFFVMQGEMAPGFPSEKVDELMEKLKEKGLSS